MHLLIATTNLGKIQEIKTILVGLPIEIQTLASYPEVFEFEEHGKSFAENARQKVLHYATATKQLTVAEDSGLEIDALGGAPGIHSARFNGDTYEKKFQRIYTKLKQQGVMGSQARFVCFAALARPDKIIYETCQTIEGNISTYPRGKGGFGYDPIFFFPPRGCTLAEMSLVDKTAVSHRGKAFLALKEFLDQSGECRK